MAKALSEAQEVNQYERHYLHKITELLYYISEQSLIAAKHRACRSSDGW